MPTRNRRRKPPPALEAPRAFASHPRFVATRDVLERARRRVAPEDVGRYAPNDPGYLGYVAAFRAVLERGEGALETSFDFTETIGLTRWTYAPQQPEPNRFRWFRVLTSAAGLLLVDENWLGVVHYDLAALLVDGFALGDAGDRDLPAHLLATVCAEAGATNSASRTPAKALCLIGEAIAVAVGEAPAERVDALCAAVEENASRVRISLEDEGDLWKYPESREFLWGQTSFDQLHPVWYDLISARFPSTTERSAALKQRLLHEGERWSQGERVLR